MILVVANGGWPCQILAKFVRHIKRASLLLQLIYSDVEPANNLAKIWQARYTQNMFKALPTHLLYIKQCVSWNTQELIKLTYKERKPTLETIFML